VALFAAQGSGGTSPNNSVGTRAQSDIVCGAGSGKEDTVHLLHHMQWRDRWRARAPRVRPWSRRGDRSGTAWPVTRLTSSAVPDAGRYWRDQLGRLVMRQSEDSSLTAPDLLASVLRAAIPELASARSVAP
jgi:hypothetical protein